jgi:hypothetical protein
VRRQLAPRLVHSRFARRPGGDESPGDRAHVHCPIDREAWDSYSCDNVDRPCLRRRILFLLQPECRADRTPACLTSRGKERKHLDQLRFKLIFSAIAEVFRGWRQAALVGLSPRLGDDMMECRTGEVCTIVGCRNYGRCTSSRRTRRDNGFLTGSSAVALASEEVTRDRD